MISRCLLLSSIFLVTSSSFAEIAVVLDDFEQSLATAGPASSDTVTQVLPNSPFYDRDVTVRTGSQAIVGNGLLDFTYVGPGSSSLTIEWRSGEDGVNLLTNGANLLRFTFELFEFDSLPDELGIYLFGPGSSLTFSSSRPQLIRPGSDVLHLDIWFSQHPDFDFRNVTAMRANVQPVSSSAQIRLKSVETISLPSATEIDITSIKKEGTNLTLIWTTTPDGAPVDIYRSMNLQSWGAPISTNNLGYFFADSDPPEDRAFYIVVPAGSPPTL